MNKNHTDSVDREHMKNDTTPPQSKQRDTPAHRPSLEHSTGFDFSDLMDISVHRITGGNLVHYGVKGMRWGRRSKSSKSSDAYKARLKNMSDDELNKRITRLSAERQLANLENPPSNRKSLRRMIADDGKRKISQLVVTGAAITLANQVSGGKISTKEAVKVIR